MSDQINSRADYAPPSAGVWPPAPGGSQVQSDVTGDVREFSPQNGWLLGLLMIVTLGIYGPFWMIRIARVVNRIAPERTVPEGVVWGLFVVEAINILAQIVVNVATARTPQLWLQAGIVSVIFGLVEAIFWWYMVFRFRSALNFILERTSPNLRRCGVFGTFFVGELYLQICLNHRITERTRQAMQHELPQAAAPATPNSQSM